MNAKKLNPANWAGQSAGLPLIDALQDLPRRHLAVQEEATCALLRGFEAMRRIQAEAAHEALDRHRSAVERLLEPCDPTVVMSIQAQLLQHGLADATRYWQAVGHVGMEMGQEVLTKLSQWGGPGAVEGARQAMDTAAALAGVGELFARPGSSPAHH